MCLLTLEELSDRLLRHNGKYSKFLSCTFSGDHSSGKPGNVREFERWQGNYKIKL